MAENTTENKAREQLEAFRDKLVSRIGKKGVKIIVAACIALIVAALIILAGVIFLKVDEIEVTGDVTVFNESEIIEAADIDIGDRLFSKSAAKIKSNIAANIPLADSIKVTKSLFGKITVKVEIADVDYYTEIDGKFYAIDSDLTVLGVSSDRGKYTVSGAVLVKLPITRTPTIGEKLVYYDTVTETDEEGETVYEVKDESFYKYSTDFLAALKESGYHPESNGVILTEKFEIILIYAEKFSINFGNSNDLDVKFRVLYEVLSEGSMQYTDKASIDISNPSRATARPNPSLDLSEFVE